VVDGVLARLDVPAGFSIIRGDALNTTRVLLMPLSQILQNLVENAIKHHDRPDGKIAIAVAEVDGRLRFSVTDDGPGIPERYREAVFKMFTTLKRRDEIEASGMGLALVRKLVAMQGGSCGIESVPGRGARIWFDWPKLEDKGAT
jgi:signal transduction histidine kinase